MSFFVIIRGPAGIGKTTIAKRLAKKLKGSRISFDKIMEKHKLDKIEGTCIREPQFVQANEITISRAKKKLSKGKAVFFDGCFYHKSQIRHLIKNLRYPHFAFTLKADVQTCIARDKKRGKNKIGAQRIKAVYNLVSRSDYGIVINVSNKTEKEVLKKIISYLPP